MLGCAGLAFIKRGHCTALCPPGRASPPGRAAPKHDFNQFVRGVGGRVSASHRLIESQRAANSSEAETSRPGNWLAWPLQRVKRELQREGGESLDLYTQVVD